MKIKHKPDVAKLRRQAYPPLEELADALYHERQGNPQPMKDYLAKAAAVKARFPK